MSVKNIEKKIIESSNDQAEQIVSDARERAADRLAAAEKNEQERAEQAEADTRDALTQQLERAATSARAANKLKLLTRKSEMLGAVFEDAVERFIGDRGGAYREWLASQVEAAGESEGTLVPAEPDRSAIEELLAEQDSPAELADESLPLRGGFVLRGDRIDEDFSLDSRLADLRAELLPELAKQAFPEKADDEKENEKDADDE